MRPGAQLPDAEARANLLAEIAAARGDLPFLTPEVEEVLVIEGRVVAVERRLPGEPVSHLLTHLDGTTRRDLLADYLDTVSRIAEISLQRAYFGPLLGGGDLRSASWAEFASARLRASLHRCPDDLRPAVDDVKRHHLPEPERASLVHLDFFPANVLALGGRVSAVLDFGATAVFGDARMDAWSAVAYLDAEISPAASAEDRLQATDWLAAKGLKAGYDTGKRWLAAYWSRATDDVQLMGWCRKVLLAHG
ncbi:hypothetical protein VE25_15640 [Devosia geojensis]|uniref:Aminoglycoside phosphotransferase domain-containing protein n=2 Tax=Devosia geojensis TaxID=443610 RepID=A0A0F5FPU2_9HYPH|nr:hypothetical protein VE25_15640 [Devosia geojensis]